MSSPIRDIPMTAEQVDSKRTDKLPDRLPRPEGLKYLSRTQKLAADKMPDTLVADIANSPLFVVSGLWVDDRKNVADTLTEGGEAAIPFDKFILATEDMTVFVRVFDSTSGRVEGTIFEALIMTSPRAGRLWDPDIWDPVSYRFVS